MKIGIYGGTFDPPHLGHMRAARAAVEQLGLDQLLLIPAAIPPHKDLPADTAEPCHRLAMTKLMAEGMNLLEGNACAKVLDMELERQGKSYTVDTLRQLREDYPEDELCLLMGSDMLTSFSTWHQPEQVAQLATIVAFPRMEEDDSAYLKGFAEGLEFNYQGKMLRLDMPPVELSSTQVRTTLQEGWHQARDLLWCQVYGYILNHGLYGTQADLTQLSRADLRACSYALMGKAKRIPHIQGCEQEAVRLAQHWGEDDVSASRAAILHDCTKYLNLKEQLSLCTEYHIQLDELEQKAVKLLHAKTGAAIAGAVYGEPEAVCQAICYHTTGRADMTRLEKILYLADYIEVSREDFEGLSEMRQLAYTDLEQAILLGCELTIQDMEERDMPVHTNTRQARAWLKGQEINE